MTCVRSDFPSPWQETLRQFPRDLLALSFPDVEASIDWDHPFEVLDRELEAAIRDAHPDRQYANKLIKVWRRDQAPEWMLLHLVVQHQPDPELSARIYRHHSRLVAAHSEPVATLVVLADAVPEWRPSIFEYESWGYRVRFAFPICKLLDFPDEAWEESTNPVAKIVLLTRA